MSKPMSTGRVIGNVPRLNTKEATIKISPLDKSGNGTVVQLAKEKAGEYPRAQKNFVGNATNITRPMRDQLIRLFSTCKAFVRIVYIEAAYENCTSKTTAVQLCYAYR